jgi:hypothetical protein
MKIFVTALMMFWGLFVWAQAQQDPCAKSCVVAAECGTGGACHKGICEYQPRFCANERWSANSRGETSNCDAYTCSNETGMCLRKAQSSNDCLVGYVFDGTSLCVPSVQCNPAEPNCLNLMERWKKARTDYEAITPEPRLSPLTCISCQMNSDCASGQMCWQGRCEKSSAFCRLSDTGEHFSIMNRRTPASCGDYACDPVPGTCLTSCLKTSECRSGKQCVAGSCL